MIYGDIVHVHRLGGKPALKEGGVLAATLTLQTHKLTWPEPRETDMRARDTQARTGSKNELAPGDWRTIRRMR
jgi:hypothetical protein